MTPTHYPRDTIVAPATPPGTGGVAIVRLSGDNVESIAAAMVGRLPNARTASLRTFSDQHGNPIDHGVALYFPGPASFTGETVIELHAHGGPVVVGLLVEAAVALGARRADPGEFSKRAFLNGKLDLAQAEAISDLIESGTRQAAAAALRSLSGEFSARVAAIAAELIELRSYVEAAIDFPDDDIDFLSDDALKTRITHCRNSYETVLQAASNGRVLRDGFQLVIVGAPNAGKSSLLNALSGADAAIVTDIAGTTRDVLRERINIDGLAVELVDTAGLRDDPDVIEAEGIRRARAALESADAAIYLTDASNLSATAIELPETLPILKVSNKVDLVELPTGPQGDTINISALNGDGLGALKDAIKELAGFNSAGEGSFTARQRHVDALSRSQRHFETGAIALRDQRAGEILAEELRLALDALGEITGHVSSDDLLGHIFSSFCIGK